jgi:hypothetical protein
MSTSIALRLSFQVPEFTKTGMLRGYRLEHLVKHSIVDEADFLALFGNSVEKLMEAIEAKAGATTRVIAKFNLTAKQAELVRYTGVSVAHHDSEVPENIPAIDARWV